MAQIGMHRSRAIWNDPEDPVLIKEINCQIGRGFREGRFDSRERKVVHRAEEYFGETVWSRGGREVRGLSKEFEREN